MDMPARITVPIAMAMASGQFGVLALAIGSTAGRALGKATLAVRYQPVKGDASKNCCSKTAIFIRPELLG